MSQEVSVSPDGLVRLATIATEAGRATLEYYHPGVAAELKRDRTPVTAADRAAHTIITRRLAEWDDSVPVISEEGDIPDAASRRTWSRFWLVDPLDGTKEFLEHNGGFTVNIALVEDGAPVLGAIHGPTMDLLYYAGEGLGSWKQAGDSRPVRLRSRPPLPGRPLRVAESPLILPVNWSSSRRPFRSESGCGQAARSSSAGSPKARLTFTPDSGSRWSGTSRPVTVSSAIRAAPARANRRWFITSRRWGTLAS